MDVDIARATATPAATARARGVPGVQRLDHVGLTVPDLNAAIGFVVEALGGEIVYRLPPLTRSDDWMRDHLDVQPRASAEIALLRLGPANLELFQYAASGQVTLPPRPVDAGSQCLGLLVNDVDAASAALREHAGLLALGPVRTSGLDSPRAGTRWVRLLAPWGMPIEVRSVPGHQPHECHTAGPRPGRPDHEGPAPVPPVPPGLSHVDHIAYTVADMDEALGIFVDILGGELLYRSDPRVADTELSAALGIPADASVEHAALRLGPAGNIEFYRYRVAGAAGHPPRNSDVGGGHLAVHVLDVDAAADHLAAQPGFVVLGAPETIDEGPIAGNRWVYVRSPIGLHIELVRRPDSALCHEGGTSTRRRAAGDLHWRDR